MFVLLYNRAHQTFPSVYIYINKRESSFVRSDVCVSWFYLLSHKAALYVCEALILVRMNAATHKYYTEEMQAGPDFVKPTKQNNLINLL